MKICPVTERGTYLGWLLGVGRLGVAVGNSHHLSGVCLPSEMFCRQPLHKLPYMHSTDRRPLARKGQLHKENKYTHDSVGTGRRLMTGPLPLSGLA